MSPEPRRSYETACDSGDSTAGGIEGNHTGQHERQTARSRLAGDKFWGLLSSRSREVR